MIATILLIFHLLTTDTVYLQWQYPPEAEGLLVRKVTVVDGDILGIVQTNPDYGWILVQPHRPNCYQVIVETAGGVHSTLDLSGCPGATLLPLVPTP